MTRDFEMAGSLSPRRDAELILGHILGCGSTDLYRSLESGEGDSLTLDQISQIEELTQRRKNGESVAYILGYRYFFKARFFVGPGVLVPRPETEHILEWSLNYSWPQKPNKILDLGCGSGCIGLSLLREFPEAQLSAVDISQTALNYAQKNAQELGLEERVSWFLGSARQFAHLEATNKKFDLIVANPPYIDPKDQDVETGVRLFEPPEALFSPDCGLQAIREFSGSALGLLAPTGYYLMEIGSGQRVAVESWLRTQWGDEINFSFLKDYSGYDRICVVSWAQK